MLTKYSQLCRLFSLAQISAGCFQGTTCTLRGCISVNFNVQFTACIFFKENPTFLGACSVNQTQLHFVNEE